MADRMVRIAHPDGREGAIAPGDFTKKNLHAEGMGSYSDQGYIIGTYEDGGAYDGPKSKREIDKAAEAKQAAKEAAKPAPAAEKGKAGS